MTLASKFVGMNIKRVTEQISSGGVVTAAIEINDAKANADRGWIDYMAKTRSKDGFDHYFDCLDIDTFHSKKIVFA